MLNLKATHRITTAMRNAFEESVRRVWKRGEDKNPLQPKKSPTMKQVQGLIEMVGDSLAHNAGVMRRPDISINVSPAEWKRLKQLKAV